ncbi:hypothetical protein BGX26_000410 [Mortierella sp. AD094]|nr:hypothetical protein BGX26_000410 [Mortierella sp. AD094]
MPRTTAIGILKDEKKLLDYLSANPSQGLDARRVVDSRTPEVERLLVGWLRKLMVQGVDVSDKKICAQAIEILRMLSSDLDELQYPGSLLYTPGWLRGFKKRRTSSLALKSVYPTSSERFSWATKVQQSNLGSLDPSDVYICDLASIFMRVMPAGEDNEPKCATQIKGCASASVLLCCNGTGRDKLSPRIFFRGAIINTNELGPEGMDLNTRLGDLTNHAFEQWLFELGSLVNRRICLLLNNSVSRHLSGIQCPEHIKIISVPDGISRFLPMSARLMMEFKAYYHTPQLLDNPNVKANLVDTYTPLLHHIHIAWSQVQPPVIKQSFEQFRVDAGILRRTPSEEATQDTVDKDDSAKTGPQSNLKSAIQDGRFEHYKHQDGDTGPSSDLWVEIQTIKSQKRESSSSISPPSMQQ